MTNADRIRNMTDEELVDFIEYDAPSCTGLCDDFGQGCYNTCKHGGGKDLIRKWLQSEVGDEDAE